MCRTLSVVILEAAYHARKSRTWETAGEAISQEVVNNLADKLKRLIWNRHYALWWRLIKRRTFVRAQTERCRNKPLTRLTAA